MASQPGTASHIQHAPPPPSPAVTRNDLAAPRRKQLMGLLQNAQTHPAIPIKNEQITTKNNLNDTDEKNNNS